MSENYTVKELLENQSFRRLVKGTATSDEIEKWNNWIEKNYQNKERAITAISEIIEIEFDVPMLPDIEHEWSKLYSKTVGIEKIYAQQRRSRKAKLIRFLKVAAMFMVISMAGLGVYYYYDVYDPVVHMEQWHEENTISTKSDEQKTLRFSDGSIVILRSNSSLTYKIGFYRNQTIEIHLEGEAWFDAKSDPSKDQPVFAIHTPDGIIRDIGTKFLVTIEDGKSRVVLQEGRVEVGPLNEEYFPNQSRFSVEKGEMVEFNREQLLRKELVNTTFYTSWATGFIEFDKTKLIDIAKYIEERFDVKVQMIGPHQNEVTLNGALYFRSLEELIRSVSEVTTIPFYQSADRDTVYIGSSNE